MKKNLCMILVVLILIGLFSGCGAQRKDNNYDYVKFGNYPQKKVTDNLIIQALNSIDAEWISCEYVQGMKYTDVQYNNAKYRGVILESYRPAFSFGSSYEKRTEQYQYKNSFYMSTVYWFLYEPIYWRILDNNKGIALCEYIIDSQPFNSDILHKDFDGDGIIGSDEMVSKSNDSVYANDYVYSTVRKWLNTEFLNTAFSSDEMNEIKESEIGIKVTDLKSKEHKPDSGRDKVFLLTRDDIKNRHYFLSGDTSALKIYGTDYSECMGLWENRKEVNGGNSWWWLCTPGNASYEVLSVISSGLIGNTDNCNYSVDASFGGIRPAIVLSANIIKTSACNLPTDVAEQESSTEVSDENYNFIFYGNYPQTLEKNEDIISVLEKLPKEYISFNFTGEDGKPSDYMKYADVEYGKQKYRAVVFSKYRDISPECPGISLQSVNGYCTNEVYWFKFEPIKWRVLNEYQNMLLSERILDSMPTNEYACGVKTKNGTVYYSNTDEKYFASDYAHSSIRTWLNNDFFNTAFNNDEKTKIVVTSLDNSAVSKKFSKYDSENTKDKIFLLSHRDLINPEYGFLPEGFHNDSARIAYPTDYARCMGIWTGGSYKEVEGDCDGASWWWLRSPSGDSSLTYGVSFLGTMPETFPNYSANYIDTGIRPAMCILKYE